MSLNLLIVNLFQSNFASLDDLISKHFQAVDSEESFRNIKEMASINPKLLEDIAHEFQLNYRTKIDHVWKEIKHTI
jgi:hypothetical protein